MNPCGFLSIMENMYLKVFRRENVQIYLIFQGLIVIILIQGDLYSLLWQVQI